MTWEWMVLLNNRTEHCIGRTLHRNHLLPLGNVFKISKEEVNEERKSNEKLVPTKVLENNTSFQDGVDTHSKLADRTRKKE
jgi:hypothetical protein